MLTSLRGKLILIFILLTVSVVIVSSGFARYKQRQFALDRARERAKVDLQLIDSDIQSVLQWVLRDLLVLHDMPSLQTYLNSDDPFTRKHILQVIKKEFLTLAAHHQIFQQVRLLDAHGNEIARVNTKNGTSWLTPDDQLQDKSDRYYFKESIRLPDGSVYISPMDLNVEQGRIEYPYVPVIRYATPVTDRDGRKHGVLVLNVFGSTFLNLLVQQQHKVRQGEHYYLLNGDGYFLFHPDFAKTFGFQLGNDETYFKYEPQIKPLLAHKRAGVSISKSQHTGKITLFGFRRIDLGSQLAGHGSLTNTSRPTTVETRHWYLLTTVDEADLLVGFDEYIQSFMPFTILLLLGCVIAAVLLAWNCSRPVESLALAAKRIHQGDLSARAQVYTVDDMGKFGNLFNEMADNLEKTIARLKLSEAKYRKLFENSRDCIFVTDTECNIIDINEAGRKLFGVGPDEPLKKLALGCCRQRDGQEEVTSLIMEDIQRSGYVSGYETFLTRADGSTRLCLMTATARLNRRGKLIGYEGILRDITEERERQEKERLFQKKLQEEIILAEERERRHIGQVLHEEMAQNLALVNLKLQEVEQRAREYCHQGYRESEHLLAQVRTQVNVMIDQIRTMIFDLYPAVLDDQGLVPAMLWYGDNFSQRTGITVFVYGVSGSLGLTKSQKIYLFRTFKELLNNAWKHGAAKEIVATVKKKENHVRLTVDDDGCGFDPQEVQSRSQDLKGIGLISIRQWILSMEGTLSIEAQPGRGSRISIDIPLNQA